MDFELWSWSRQAEREREAARIQLTARARRLSKAERRARRRPHDWSAPRYHRQTPTPDRRGSWAHLF